MKSVVSYHVYGSRTVLRAAAGIVLRSGKFVPFAEPPLKLLLAPEVLFLLTTTPTGIKMIKRRAMMPMATHRFLDPDQPATAPRRLAYSRIDVAPPRRRPCACFSFHLPSSSIAPLTYRLFFRRLVCAPATARTFLYCFSFFFRAAILSSAEALALSSLSFDNESVLKACL